jgi:glycyl-tRNA synthetase beta subunit
VAQLERIATAKGEYLGVRKKLPRLATAAVLRDELPALVTGLKFPKTMKWEAAERDLRDRCAGWSRYTEKTWCASVLPMSRAAVSRARDRGCAANRRRSRMHRATSPP